MVAIMTKYLAPTNTKGARIKAYTDTGAKIIIDFPPCNSDEAHRIAARALMARMNWNYEVVQGATAHGSAFVMLPKNQTIVTKAQV